MLYKVQSIFFYKNKISLEDAVKWMTEHKYKIKKVDETENLYRFRLIPPTTLKKQGYDVYRNLSITPIITLVLAYKN
jgi:hypothetical protein